MRVKDWRMIGMRGILSFVSVLLHWQCNSQANNAPVDVEFCEIRLFEKCSTIVEMKEMNCSDRWKLNFMTMSENKRWYQASDINFDHLSCPSIFITFELMKCPLLSSHTSAHFSAAACDYNFKEEQHLLWSKMHATIHNVEKSP